MQVGDLCDLILLHYFLNYEIEISASILFFDLADNTYCTNICIYIDSNKACQNRLRNIFGLVDLNADLFESFEAYFLMFDLTYYFFYLLEINNLVRENKAWILQCIVCRTFRTR